MKGRILLSLMLFSITSYGQNMEPDQFTSDSLEIVKLKLVRPQFRFDNRQTFVDKQVFYMRGFDAGVLLAEKLRVTLGYYAMADRITQFDEIKADGEHGRQIDLRFGTLNTEFIYHDTRFLSLGVPLELGVGVNKFQRMNFTSGEVIITEKGMLVFVNFGVSATFKPLRSIGLKGMAGYRKVVINQVKDYPFDGFFTGVGLNVDIYAMITGYRMYKLKKKYNRGNNVKNAVDIITD